MELLGFAHADEELTEIQPTRTKRSKAVNVEIACLLCSRLIGEWHQLAEHDARRLLAQVGLRRVRCGVCGGPPVVSEITPARRAEPKLDPSAFRLRPGRPPKHTSEESADES
jgi:hypothetical protein